MAPPKQRQGIGSNNTEICPICEKKADHELIECEAREGCSKCKVPTKHSADNCPIHTDYPPHDQQVCDSCLEPGHEVRQKKCKKANRCKKWFHGADCRYCGHGGHDHNRKDPENPCPIFKILDKVSARNQMTPYYFRNTILPKPSPPSSPKKTPPKSGSTTGSSPRQQSLNNTSLSSTRGVGAITQGVQNVQFSEKDALAQEKADKQKLYDEAEKNIVKLKTKREENEQLDNETRANFFRIHLNTGVVLHRYNIILGTIPRMVNGVQQAVAITNRKAKRYLIGTLLNDPTSTPRPLHNNWATDYNSTIISVGDLFPNSATGPFVSTPVIHPRSGTAGQTVTMTSRVIYQGNVRTDLLKKHVNFDSHVPGANPIMLNGNPYDPTEDLKALNIISWRNINDDTIFLDGGRHGNKFYPRLVNEAPAYQRSNMYMIRSGFFTSMRPGQDSVLLNVNVTTSAFYSPINLQTWFNLANKLGISFRDQQVKLKNVKVIFDVRKTNHPPKNYTIHAIGMRDTSNTRFTFNSTPITVFNYMRQTYGLVNPAFRTDATCVNAGGLAIGTETWVPADKCTIVDWQVVTGLLDETNAAAMVTPAKKKPQVCKDLINNHARRHLGIHPLLPFYQQFGIRPESDMMSIYTRTLASPALALGNRQTKQPYKGGWNFQGATILQGANRASIFHCISFAEPIGSPEKNNMWDALVHHRVIERGVNGRRNFYLTQAQIPGPGYQPASFRQRCITALNNALGALTATSNTSPPIILVILPSFDRHFYPEIKRWGDCEAGIPTACVQMDKFRGADDGFLANLCLKINLKLEGVSHRIHGVANNNVGPCGTPRATMIVGADVTHPGKGLDGCPSIAAVVATNDDVSSHYLGSARLQKSRDEYIHDLEGMMKERVLAWHKKAIADPAVPLNRLLPFHILFYRDGVSESQFGMALHEELPQIYEGCKKALDTLRTEPANRIPNNHPWRPRITMIVVTKRHHARFSKFKDVVPDHRTEDVNLPCGLVADTQVVTPNQFSFYLQSHDSYLGSARNGHYVVLHDDLGYNANRLQTITNRICYTGARATKALSVATPARYADFLCDRLRNYMNPVFAGLHTVAPSVGPTHTPLPNSRPIPAPVHDYENDLEIWNTAATTGGRKNPWHPRLDDIMFYL